MVLYRELDLRRKKHRKLSKTETLSITMEKTKVLNQKN